MCHGYRVKSTRKHSKPARPVGGTPEKLHAHQSNTNGAARVSKRSAASKAPLSTLTCGEMAGEYGAIQHPFQDPVLPRRQTTKGDGLAHWQKTRRAQDCSCARDGFGRKPVYAAFASSSRLSPLSASNSCRSAASWHLMQYLVHGTASKRLILISSSQCMQTP